MKTVSKKFLGGINDMCYEKTKGKEFISDTTGQD